MVFKGSIRISISYQWLSMVINKLSMVIKGYQCLSMVINYYQWLSMVIDDCTSLVRHSSAIFMFPGSPPAAAPRHKRYQ